MCSGNLRQLSEGMSFSRCFQLFGNINNDSTAEDHNLMDTWMNYTKVLVHWNRKTCTGGKKNKKNSRCLFSVLLSCCHCCHFPVSAGGAMTSLPNVFNVHCALNDGTCAAVFSALSSPWALSEWQSPHFLKLAINTGHRFKSKLTRKADAAGETHSDGREGAACLHSGGHKHMLPLRQSVMGDGGVGGGGVFLIIADKEQMRGKSHRQTTCGHIVK